MGSPLLSAAWWFPELQKGREPLDNFFDALHQWAPTHRFRDTVGTTHNNLLGLLPVVQQSKLRFVQASPGGIEEITADKAVQKRIFNSGGEGIFLGQPRTQLDGIFDTSYLLTARFVSPQIVEWNLESFELALPPLINETPRTALGNLRKLEHVALERLKSSSSLLRNDEARAEDLRNALIDLDQKLCESDYLLYPKSVNNNYLQLLSAADHVIAIVDIVQTRAPHTESTLRPLIRAAQNARSAAWCEWMFTTSARS